MRLNLFHIPREIWGWPVFGAGWLLALWAIVSLVIFWRQWRSAGWSGETGATLLSIAVTGAAIWLVLPALVDETGLPIRGYGVMLVVAIFSAVALAMRRARQANIDPDTMISLSMALVLAGIAGARIFFVVQHWRQFQKETLRETALAMLSFSEGGLVVYGSLIGGAFALWWFIRKHRLPGLAFADLAAPSVLLGMGLGRIGCFFTGCCFGGACDLPWAVTFPWASPPHVDQAERGEIALEGIRFDWSDPNSAVIKEVEPDSPAAQAGLQAGDRIRAIEGRVDQPTHHGQRLRAPFRTPDALSAIGQLERVRPGEEIAVWVERSSGSESGNRNTPGEHEIRWRLDESPPRSARVHPAQLYSAFDALLLCLFLLAYAPYQRRDGELLAIVMSLHPISRFMLEMIRTDEPAVFNTPFSISQNISLVILAGGIALWGILISQPPRRALVAPTPV